MWNRIILWFARRLLGMNHLDELPQSTPQKPGHFNRHIRYHNEETNGLREDEVAVRLSPPRNFATKDDYDLWHRGMTGGIDKPSIKED